MKFPSKRGDSIDKHSQIFQYYPYSKTEQWLEEIRTEFKKRYEASQIDLKNIEDKGGTRHSAYWLIKGMNSIYKELLEEWL